MKKLLLALLALAWTQAGFAEKPAVSAAADDEDETVRLGDNNILFYYEANADIPSSNEVLTRTYSSEYRDARTEFEKVDIMQKVLPVIARKVAKAAEAREVMVRIHSQVPAYDFTRKGFSTGLNADTFIPFNLPGAEYAVVFKGIKNYGFVAVPETAASRLQGRLAKNREGYLEIYGKLSGAEEQSLGSSLRKVVFVRPNRVAYFLQDGTPIGEIVPPAK